MGTVIGRVSMMLREIYLLGIESNKISFE